MALQPRSSEERVGPTLDRGMDSRSRLNEEKPLEIRKALRRKVPMGGMT